MQKSISILIPTRNRVDLLKFALESALNQSYSNFDVIVSDNCSQDDTSNYLSSVNNAKLKFVRPDKLLSFKDHWEFLLNFSTSDYVIFLCDDDALHPEALFKGVQCLDRFGVDIVCWKWAFWNIKHQTLTFSVSKGCEILNGKNVASKIINGDFGPPKPQLNNCLIPKKQLVEMVKNFPYAFSPFGGDFASSVYLLCKRPKFCFVNECLSVFTEWDGSLTEAVRSLDHNAVDEYFKKGGGYPAIPHNLPLDKLPLISNRIFSNILEARRVSNYDVKWDPFVYFALCKIEIDKAFSSSENWDYFYTEVRKFPNLAKQIDEFKGKSLGFLNPTHNINIWNGRFFQVIKWAFRPNTRRFKCLKISNISNMEKAINILLNKQAYLNKAWLPSGVSLVS